MPNHGDTIWMLCNEHLHPFEVAVATVDIECPYCGCKYARIDHSGGDTAATMNVDVKEPFTLDTKTWVSDLPDKQAHADPE